MENKCDIEFIKSKFNELKIRWNAAQDSHEKYILTILDYAEDSFAEHDRRCRTTEDQVHQNHSRKRKQDSTLKRR